MPRSPGFGVSAAPTTSDVMRRRRPPPRLLTGAACRRPSPALSRQAPYRRVSIRWKSLRHERNGVGHPVGSPAPSIACLYVREMRNRPMILTRLDSIPFVSGRFDAVAARNTVRLANVIKPARDDARRCAAAMRFAISCFAFRTRVRFRCERTGRELSTELMTAQALYVDFADCLGVQDQDRLLPLEVVRFGGHEKGAAMANTDLKLEIIVIPVSDVDRARSSTRSSAGASTRISTAATTFASSNSRHPGPPVRSSSARTSPPRRRVRPRVST